MELNQEIIANLAKELNIKETQITAVLKARENCAMYYPGEEFDLRLGSGVEVLANSEVDAVVMAGMGGILMTEILEKDVPKSRSFRKLILQPRKDVGKLRYWLFDNGFSITNEGLVREVYYYGNQGIRYP